MNKNNPPVVQLRVLGPPAVLVAGQPVAGLLKKSEGLLYLLAVSGRSWARAELAEMLWDDGGPAGRQSLRVALTKLPKPWGEVLRRDGDRLELSADCDLHRWDERCTAVRTYLSDGSTDKAEAALQAHCHALAEWPGWLLDGFNIDAPQFDDWLYAQRQRVQRYWAETVIAAVERLAAAAQWPELEAVLQRLLQLDPAHETAHRWLIQCFVQTGRPEAARGQFELCKRQLATLAGAAPSEATRAALQGAVASIAIVLPVMVAGEAPASAPAASLPNVPNNLPRQVNSFVGRQRDLAAVVDQIRRHRFVTLVGSGGMGKTRLSVEVGFNLLAEFPAGVWFVDLAAVHEDAQVAQAMTGVLALRDEPGVAPITAAEKFVRDRKMLVILDNCEHVLEGTSELAYRLVQAGEAVCVLATSRERLRVAGEAIYDLPALDLPDRAEAMSPEDLLPLDAVHLFVDRAQAARSNFRLETENAAAIVGICRRLDGIPLALELAAARLRTLSVTSVAAQLQNRFRLPGSSDHSHPERQRTLESLIEWSYELLNEDEAIVLRRLAIFAGGWTLASAEEVVADGRLEGDDVVDATVRLVEKSLVVFDAAVDRYRLLETVRHFARGRLDDSGEADELRERHVHHFLALAEGARPKLAGPLQAEWLARLDAERENLHAALARSALLDNSADMGARFIYSLRPFWERSGLMAVALAAVTQVLSRSGLEIRNERRCKTLFNAGSICNFSGQWSQARVYLTECLEISREIGNSYREAEALQQLGRTCFELDDRQKAQVCLHQSLALAERLGNKRELAFACNVLAQYLRLANDEESAERLYERALSIARDLGDQENIALFLLNLAMLSIKSQALERARSNLREALAIAEITRSRPVGQSVLEVCSGLAAESGDWQCSARFFGAAEEQARVTGLRRDAADEAFLAPLIAKTRQALGVDQFAIAQATYGKLPLQEMLRKGRSWLNAGNCNSVKD
jgi:predicted ATPase/DNA-binding SARP family transcriptional activator